MAFFSLSLTITICKCVSEEGEKIYQHQLNNELFFLSWFCFGFLFLSSCQNINNYDSSVNVSQMLYTSIVHNSYAISNMFIIQLVK